MKKEINERIYKLAGELSMAEDKLKQMFGLEEEKFKFEENMRKESDEDDEYYDRTKEPEIKKISEEESSRLREAAKNKSYNELKNKLSDLLNEKQDINDNMMAMVQASLKMMNNKQEDLGEVDELDKITKENEGIVRDQQKKENIQRMIKITNEIEE